MSNEYLFQQEVKASRYYITNRLARRGISPDFIGARADEIMEAVNHAFMLGDNGRTAQSMIDERI